MRLQVEFALEDSEIVLPLQYNHLVQAAIYRTLEGDFGDFLHDKGYQGGGRTFKLFTFSRLLGKYRIVGEKIIYNTAPSIVISSPVTEFCQFLLNGLLTKGTLRLGEVVLKVNNVSVANPLVVEEKIILKLISPVVAYSTLLKPEGSKYTCYHQPGEGEFTRIVGENLRKKYRALYQTEPRAGELVITSNSRYHKLHVVKYKGMIIKGYSGQVELTGSREVLQVAVEAGLGSKNSMGFGCGELKLLTSGDRQHSKLG